jgi:hypothetical protein
MPKERTPPAPGSPKGAAPEPGLGRRRLVGAALGALGASAALAAARRAEAGALAESACVKRVIYDPTPGNPHPADHDDLEHAGSLTGGVLGPPADGQGAMVLGHAEPGDGGDGLFYYDASYRPPAFEVPGATVVRSLLGGSGVWRRVFDGSISVKCFGARGDGQHDDTAAIQSAIDWLGFASPHAQSIVDPPAAGEILFPNGVYRVSSPIKTYSGIALRGFGPRSVIEGAPSFAGRALVVLHAKLSPQKLVYFVAGSIDDLAFKGAGLTAVTHDGEHHTAVLNSRFTRLYLGTRRGLALGDQGFAYLQACEVDTIYAFGSDVESVLDIDGNCNVLRNIDVEPQGSDPSSETPYLRVTRTPPPGAASDEAAGNLLENVVVENVLSKKKPALVLERTRGTMLHGFHYEALPEATHPHALQIKDSDGVRISGDFQVQSSAVLVLRSLDVRIEQLRQIGLFIDPDLGPGKARSSVVVGTLESTAGANAFPIGRAPGDRWTVEETLNRALAAHPEAAPGHSFRSRQRYLTAQNLLVNPSFEAGRFAWTFSRPPLSEAYAQSEVGAGLMAVFDAAPGTVLSQEVAVPWSWRNQTLTFSALVGLRAPGGAVLPYLSGAGTAPTATMNAVSAVGWSILSQTFTLGGDLPEGGTVLEVGVRVLRDPGYPKDEAVVIKAAADECWLAFGTEGIVSPGKFGSLELHGSTHAAEAACPTTGTWKVGDIVWNQAPSVEGTPPRVVLGWIFTKQGWAALHVPVGVGG